VNILERAIPHWAESSVVFYLPLLSLPENWPEGLKLARRIADDYGGIFKKQLLELLLSDSVEVACQSLAVLTWGRLIDPCEIPELMREDQREITLAACLLPRFSVSEFARMCEADLLQP
jgi:hypothetical protein